jgi:SAM-dependent methyltransferase
MNPIIDTRLAAMRRRRALSADRPADFLMLRAIGEMEERLSAVQHRFASAATLFCVLPEARDRLSAGGKVDHVLRLEDAALFEAREPDMRLAEDMESLPLDPQSLDLAVSLHALHELNDVPGMLLRIRRALRPDGLFLGCMAGAGTLAELREALSVAELELKGGVSPRIIPFADIRDAGALLQRAGFALPVADTEEIVVRYDTMFGLMRDLRAMGATNALVERSRVPPGRRFFMRAAEIYAERVADADGRVRATFNTIWMSGWAPSPTQQQPLRPGSAEVSLAKVLGGNGGGR